MPENITSVPSVLKNYHEKKQPIVKAVQWDGTETMMDKLLALFPTGTVRMWLVKDNGLRIDYAKYQGQDWCEVGNYLVFSGDRLFIYSKYKFDQQFEPA